MKRPALLLVILASVVFSASTCAADQPLNFVVIISDDQGWNDIGYRNAVIKTPHLDALAKSGVVLDQFYVWPTCSPTRVALLTGRPPSRWGVLGPIGGKSRQAIPKTVTMLPKALSQTGYFTAMAGKWHLGLRPEVGPQHYGFASSYGYLHGQIDPYTHLYKFGDVTWHRDGKFLEETGHVTDLISDEAVRVIKQQRKQPFFLYVAYSVPHYPLNEPDEWTQPYDKTTDDPWRKQFAASVTHMDAGIGRIVQALDDSRQRERTVIVYLSDNGGQRSWGSPDREYEGRYPAHTTLGDNTPLRGWKGDLAEGGIRVPAFINGLPKLPAGREKLPVSAVDLYPTIASLAGCDIRDDWQLEGHDVAPLLYGEQRSAWVDNRVLYWKTSQAHAVRQGHWKLIVHKNGKQELFNIHEDPLEKRECSQDHASVVQTLKQLLQTQQKRDASTR